MYLWFMYLWFMYVPMVYVCTYGLCMYLSAYGLIIIFFFDLEYTHTCSRQK